MENVQVPIPPPLTKEQVAKARARVQAILNDLQRQGIDPERLADPVEMLKQLRDATSST